MATGEETLLPPTMGWNSWYALGRDKGWPITNETTVRDTGRALVETGLNRLGYRFLVVDDSWENTHRESDGTLMPNPRKFPSGMKNLSTYLSSLEGDIVLGLYTTPGNFTCSGEIGGGERGSWDHVKQDIDLWVNDWGVGYVKNCVCNTTKSLRRHAYGDMKDAISSTGRNVVYECDNFMDKPWLWLNRTCDILAISDDVGDSFSSWLAVVDGGFEDGALPNPIGSFSSLDYLQIDVSNGGQTAVEYESQFAAYAILRVPLFIGTDLRTIDDESLAIYSNREVIAVSQDPSAAPPIQLTTSARLRVFARVMKGHADSGPVCALFVLNAGVESTNATVEWSDLSALGRPWGRVSLMAVRDIRRGRSLGFLRQNVTLPLDAHESAILRITAIR